MIAHWFLSRHVSLLPWISVYMFNMETLNSNFPYSLYSKSLNSMFIIGMSVLATKTFRMIITIDCLCWQIYVPTANNPLFYWSWFWGVQWRANGLGINKNAIIYFTSIDDTRLCHLFICTACVKPSRNYRGTRMMEVRRMGLNSGNDGTMKEYKLYENGGNTKLVCRF